LDRSQHEETGEALYLNSGFVYSSAEEAEAAFAQPGERYVYSRYANPTVATFERRLADFEGAEACRATASGMAAVFAALACQVRAGSRVVASEALFSSCRVVVGTILPKWGVHVTFVPGADLEAWRDALSTPTDVVLIETPSNPMLELVDLEAVSTLAHAAGATVVVDNVFATPALQRPLQHGADVVVYSATKHIDGQGRVLAGAVLGSDAFMDETFMPFFRHTGPSLSPFSAWLLSKSLETLELRVERQSQTAAVLADRLAEQPAVSRVSYPGREDHPQHALAQRQMDAGGPLLTFELAGGKPAAFELLNALTLIDRSNNLGDTKSLACHPASTTHASLAPEVRARLGISEGVVRLSVGLEDPDDLTNDLLQTLA
jgi:O-succinylhomoserine sulfhydrylase